MSDDLYKIIIDTREKLDHIEKAFIKNSIAYKKKAMKFGDYCIVGENGIVPKVVIERKNSIDELLGNLLDKKTLDADGNNRFYRELNKIAAANYRVILLVEDGKLYENILKGNYRSKAKPKAVRGQIMSLEAKYPNLSIVGVKKDLAASYIHSVLKYFLRERLKEE